MDFGRTSNIVDAHAVIVYISYLTLQKLHITIKYTYYIELEREQSLSRAYRRYSIYIIISLLSIDFFFFSYHVLLLWYYIHIYIYQYIPTTKQQRSCLRRNWIELNWIELNETEVNWMELNQIKSNRQQLHSTTISTVRVIPSVFMSMLRTITVLLLLWNTAPKIETALYGFNKKEKYHVSLFQHCCHVRTV